MTYPNGKVVKGIWKDDKFFKKDAIAESEDKTQEPFSSSLPTCKGTHTHSNQWTNCQGTLTWANGNKYVGEYKDGRFHGQGTFTWSAGGKYVGEFKDGKKHGQGTFTWSNGKKYVGEYKDGMLEGQGTMTYADGAKYVGEFDLYVENGQGTMTYPNGKVVKGIWKDGELIKEE